MAIAARIAAAGLPPAAAQAINGEVATGLKALGKSQGTALHVGAAVMVLEDVAAGSGVVLPDNASPTDSYVIYNGGANAVNVYPPLGGFLNNLAANAPVILASTKAANFVCVEALKWIALPGA